MRVGRGGVGAREAAQDLRAPGERVRTADRQTGSTQADRFADSGWMRQAARSRTTYGHVGARAQTHFLPRNYYYYYYYHCYYYYYYYCYY